MASSNSTQSRKRRFGPFLLRELASGMTNNGINWISEENGTFEILWTDKRRDKEVNPLIKKWAVYNNRYKEGDKEDWGSWKQTFKGALERSPDIERLEYLQSHKRVYQFVQSLNNKDRKKNECSNKIDSFQQANCAVVYPALLPRELNIPKVVMDELNRDLNIQYNSINTSCQEYNSKIPQTLDRGFEIQDQNNQTDPFRLTSNEVDELFMQNSSCFSEAFSSSDIPDIFLEEENPFMKFEVYYCNNKVLEATMNNESNNSLRLFHGLDLNNEIKTKYPHLFGPQDIPSMLLPDINLVNEKKQNNYKNLKRILHDMNRGLLLRHFDGKMFVMRLCRPYVFAWNKKDGSIVLDRKNKSFQLLFDMSKFRTLLENFKCDPNNQVCPSSTVVLTFGQEYSAIHDDLWMHIKLTFLDAERMIQQEIHEDPDLLFSGFDSCDRMLENFKVLQLNS